MTNFPVSDVVRQHLPLIGTVILFAFVVVRVLAVSNFDATTALAIVATAGLLDVTLGVIVSAYWVFVFVLFIFARAWHEARSRAEMWSAAAFQIMWAAGAFMVLFAPWALVAFSVAITVLYSWIGRSLSRRREEPVDPWFSARSASWWLLGVVVIFGINAWLPAEVLSVREEPPVLGYVLSTSDGWTSVLTLEGKDVLRLRSVDVTDRVVCSVLPSWNFPIYQWLLSGPPDTPECSELALEVATR